METKHQIIVFDHDRNAYCIFDIGLLSSIKERVEYWENRRDRNLEIVIQSNDNPLPKGYGDYDYLNNLSF